MLHKVHARRAFFRSFLGSLPSISIRSSSGMFLIVVAMVAKGHGACTNGMGQLVIDVVSVRLTEGRDERGLMILLPHGHDSTATLYNLPLLFPPHPPVTFLDGGGLNALTTRSCEELLKREGRPRSCHQAMKTLGSLH